MIARSRGVNHASASAVFGFITLGLGRRLTAFPSDRNRERPTARGARLSPMPLKSRTQSAMTRTLAHRASAGDRSVPVSMLFETRPNSRDGATNCRALDENHEPPTATHGVAPRIRPLGLL